MKKFAKVSLIISGVLFSIGVVILILCSIFAGKMRHTLSDTVSTELHNTLNNDIFGINGLNWHLHHHDFNSNFPTYSGHHTDDNATGDSVITELYLDLGCVEFTLAPSPDDAFHITSKGNGKYQYYVDGNAFYIDGFTNDRAFGFTNNHNKLILEAPDIDFARVDIDLGAGKATLSAIKSDTVVIDIGAGELTIDDISCNDINADIGAGSVLIQNGTSENADFDVSMGSLTYKGCINADLSADVSMGDITLDITDSRYNHNYLLECAMGNITLGKKEYGGMAREIQDDNGADSTYSLTCSMGNIAVSFADSE